MYIYYHLKMKNSLNQMTDLLEEKHTVSRYLRIISEINLLKVKINNLNFINN